MGNFDLYTPTHISFGKGATEKLREQAPAKARVLITYGDGSMKKMGVLNQVLTAPNGLDVLEFGNIESGSSYETLINAVRLACGEKVTFLLTVGSDSALDGTEFTAAAVHCDAAIDLQEIPGTYGSKTASATPMDSVLTLPMTGSESSRGAVISRKTTGDKRTFMSSYVQSQSAILDPVYAYTLPPRQVANDVVGAFVHTIEQYATYLADGKIQDRFAEDILLALVENGPKALRGPGNCDAHANVMQATTQVLNGLIGADVPQDWAIHMLDHELTVMHGLDHAQMLAIALPALWNEERDIKRAKLLQYVERVWNITEGSEEQRIGATIAATRSFFKQIRVSTRLSDYGFDGSPIPALLAKLEEHGMAKLDEYQNITLDVSCRIHEAAH